MPPPLSMRSFNTKFSLHWWLFFLTALRALYDGLIDRHLTPVWGDGSNEHPLCFKSLNLKVSKVTSTSCLNFSSTIYVLCVSVLTDMYCRIPYKSLLRLLSYYNIHFFYFSSCTRDEQPQHPTSPNILLALLAWVNPSPIMWDIRSSVKLSNPYNPARLSCSPIMCLKQWSRHGELKCVEDSGGISNQLLQSYVIRLLMIS